jgi:Arc/MetJ-type ribon-helix-helix transcriptional regulator
MSEPNKLHHLMRVRIRKTLFDRLKAIAETETDRSGEYTSVSDLVRAALLTWVQTHECTLRLHEIDQRSSPPKNVVEAQL